MKEWPIIDVDLMATMTGGLRSNVCEAVDRICVSVNAYCCQLDLSKTVSGIPGAVHFALTIKCCFEVKGVLGMHQ